MISLTLALGAVMLTACGDLTVDGAKPGTGDSGSEFEAECEVETTAWGGSMVHISAGTFTMGGGLGDSEAEYVDHEVTLTHDFLIGTTEVTRGQWESHTANADWAYDSVPEFPCTTSTTLSDCPAESLPWYDAAKYANALSTTEGLTPCYLADGMDLAETYRGAPHECAGYRLPTEAEWEFAARAGEDTTYAGSNTVAEVAWTYENADSVGTYAHEVATLSPSAWGLYDMSGNVLEWINDWYDVDYGGYGDGGAQSDPSGPTSAYGHGVRGGGWDYGAYRATVAYRNGVGAEGYYYTIGFRLARSCP